MNLTNVVTGETNVHERCNHTVHENTKDKPRTLISLSTRTGVDENTPSPVPHTISFEGSLSTTGLKMMGRSTVMRGVADL